MRNFMFFVHIVATISYNLPTKTLADTHCQLWQLLPNNGKVPQQYIWNIDFFGVCADAVEPRQGGQERKKNIKSLISVLWTFTGILLNHINSLVKKIFLLIHNPTITICHLYNICPHPKGVDCTVFKVSLPCCVSLYLYVCLCPAAVRPNLNHASLTQRSWALIFQS